MANNVIQKYFNRVLAWLWNLNIVQRAKHANFLIRALRLIRPKGTRSSLEDRFIYVLDPDSKEVVQWARMGDVNDDGTPKKIWINLNMSARKTIDE